MKKNRHMQKMVNKLVMWSFKDGAVVESNVIKSIKILKTQPGSSAVAALGEYLKNLKREQRKHTLYIETVIPLSQDHLKKIKKIVDRKIMVTKIVTRINPEILGGFRLQVGDEVWDASILAKINQVKEAIIHGRHH